MIAHVAGCAVSYLLGGVPLGLLVGKAKGVDVREHGSGNVGATNVGRLLGTKYFLVVMVGDAAKAAAATLLCQHAFRMQEWWLGIGGGLSVVGHCFSPYLKLKGGKGVAAGLGYLVALDWRAGVICLALWMGLVACTRYVSLSSVIAYAAAPLVLLGLGNPPAYWVSVAGMAALAVARHDENLARLRAGTERKLGAAPAEKVNPLEAEVQSLLDADEEASAPLPDTSVNDAH